MVAVVAVEHLTAAQQGLVVQALVGLARRATQQVTLHPQQTEALGVAVGVVLLAACLAMEETAQVVS
jgi:hypothetical protein